MATGEHNEKEGREKELRFLSPKRFALFFKVGNTNTQRKMVALNSLHVAVLSSRWHAAVAAGRKQWLTTTTTTARRK